MNVQGQAVGSSYKRAIMLTVGKLKKKNAQAQLNPNEQMWMRKNIVRKHFHMHATKHFRDVPTISK